MGLLAGGGVSQCQPFFNSTCYTLSWDTDEVQDIRLSLYPPSPHAISTQCSIFLSSSRHSLSRKSKHPDRNNLGGGGRSTLLADNTQGLITTKQTTPRPVAFAAPHPITPTWRGGGGKIGKLFKKSQKDWRAGGMMGEVRYHIIIWKGESLVRDWRRQKRRLPSECRAFEHLPYLSCKGWKATDVTKSLCWNVQRQSSVLVCQSRTVWSIEDERRSSFCAS